MSYLSYSTLGAATADPGSPEAIGQRAARGAIDQYVSYLKQGSLSKAFWVQDPRQEIVTAAHRDADPCYGYVSMAALAYVPPLATEYLRVAQGVNVSFIADQALLMQRRLVAGQGFDAAGAALNNDDLRAIFTSATENAEYDAKLAGSTQVGRVIPTSSPTPAAVAEEQRQVRSGQLVRGPLASADVVTPAQQRARAAAVAASPAPAVGPTYVRGTLPPLPASRVNWLLVGGLGLFGTAFLLAWKRREKR